MNAMILCEGESDGIVLSQYFHYRFGFSFVKGTKCANDTRRAFQYVKDKMNLTIQMVGGCTNFCTALEDVLRVNHVNTDDENQFTHIAVIADHDSDREKNNLLQNLNQVLEDLNDWSRMPTLQEGNWCQGIQNTDMVGRLVAVELLFLSIPLEENGALETLLLSALEKKAGSEYLAQQSREFIDELMQNQVRLPKEYLASRAEQVKAPLAVFFAVAAPTRMYQKQQAVFDMIDWSSLEEMQRTLQAFDIFDAEEQGHGVT